MGIWKKLFSFNDGTFGVMNTVDKVTSEDMELLKKEIEKCIPNMQTYFSTLVKYKVLVEDNQENTPERVKRAKEKCRDNWLQRIQGYQYK